jgi:hypothetical protein
LAFQPFAYQLYFPEELEVDHLRRPLLLYLFQLELAWALPFLAELALAELALAELLLACL